MPIYSNDPYIKGMPINELRLILDSLDAGLTDYIVTNNRVGNLSVWRKRGHDDPEQWEWLGFIDFAAAKWMPGERIN